VKPSSLAYVILCSLCLAACGGSGSGNTPPPPTGNFSNASLNGQYAFSMSGLDLNGGYIARAGSFIADGNGAITAGLEDLISPSSGGSLVSFTGGTYTIQANGRGLMVLNAASGGGLQLNIALSSNAQGVMVETDLNATSSGTLALQTTSDFTEAALNGSYVFDFSGLSFAQNVLPFSTVGQFSLDGNGNLTGGLIDENNGNASAPSGPTSLDPSTYQLDSSGNNSTFGRGTLSFGGRDFAFYIVNHTRLKVIEEDSPAATLGDAILQSANIPAQNSGFTGSFAYLVGGSSVIGSQGADARVARFTADGSGAISAISFDENNDGSTRHISQGSNISAATYSIDTANAGSGRGTFTFTDSGGGTYSYIFYLSSPTQAVLQDTSNGVVADGPMQAQSGSPFTNTTIAGNYVFNWSGVQLGSQNAIPFEEDFVGQYVLADSSSNNASGVMDFTELGLSSNQLFPNTTISGSFTIDGDGTNDNKFQVLNHNSPTVTYNFVAYVVNATTTYMLVTDNTRVTAGIANQQTP
jgi:hypothetical protein